MSRLIALLIIISSCSTHSRLDRLSEENLSDLLGQKIILKGNAINDKLGALLLTEDNLNIWIDNKDSWPEGYYEGEDNCKTLKVTGTLIERYDLPVFVYREGEEMRSGIPVPDGTDLKKASRRYLLKKIKWEVVSN